MRDVIWALLGTGCAAPKEAGIPLDPAEVETELGIYQLSLDHEPFVAGDAVLSVTVRRDGAAVDGAELTLEPWMPDMGHGASDPPVIEALGGGAYRGSWVFAMPGYWELGITVDAEAGTDSVTVAYEVE